MQVFSPEQARSFLVACCGERLEGLYWLALSTGLRRGELLALKWDDLDLDAGRLSVRRSLGRSSTQGIVIEEPKTRQGRRTVRISAPAVAVLRVHRKRQLEQRLQAGPQWRDTGCVFTTSIGTTIDPRNLELDFRQMLAKVPTLSAIRFHDLRHSAATIALRPGCTSEDGKRDAGPLAHQPDARCLQPQSPNTSGRSRGENGGSVGGVEPGFGSKPTQWLSTMAVKLTGSMEVAAKLKSFRRLSRRSGTSSGRGSSGPPTGDGRSASSRPPASGCARPPPSRRPSESLCVRPSRHR